MHKATEERMRDTMYIGIANVINGTETPVGDGKTGAERCVIVLEDGSQRAAILKKGTLGQIKAECFCALLLRALGLTVPDPYIVFLSSEEIAFASADLTYPNLKKHLSVDLLPDGPAKEAAINCILELVAKFKSTPLALSIDEAIDNRDRNLGNILWDGESEAWIDHAYCLGEGALEGMEDINKLACMMQQLGIEERISRSAIGQSFVISGILSEVILNEVSSALSEHINVEDSVKFISNRLPTLQRRILDRFPKNDLLAGL